MDDLDGVLTMSSTRSSLDSGLDNVSSGFLSDCSSSSSKSDCERTHTTTCVLANSHSHHYCPLNLYNLSGRCIETLSPRTFLYLADCVRVLDLSNNTIKALPETISELRNLRELNLSCNELQGVPDSCAKLNKLQVLNLSQNQLIEPPACLELGVEQLTRLDLSKNFICKFPNPPKCSLSLECLNLSHNCFNLLPLWLFSDKCRSLTELDVSFNFCFDDNSLQAKLPLMKHHRTSVLKSLRNLKMCNTGYSENDPKLFCPLSSFESLQTVHMGNLQGPDSTFNLFLELPVSLFCNPEKIVELHLPKIGLAGLPDDICKFRNVEVLDVSNNMLDWLPETFGSLQSLRELIASDCNLIYLPENFGQLKNLKKLILDHNKLTDVQSALEGCVGLEWLDVYDNCLEELPLSLDSLRKLHMTDLAHNYFDVESVLDVEENGENVLEVYRRQQARLREAWGPDRPRNDGRKFNQHVRSWESLESLHKSFRSGSLSDISHFDGNLSYQNFNLAEDEPEEDWDKDSGSDNDGFEPHSVHRYPLIPGVYRFGWIPDRKKQSDYDIPIKQKVSGHVFVPGQLHQKPSKSTKLRNIEKCLRQMPVAEDQFADACVDDFADLQKAESLGALLKKMCMFVRNPEGLRTKKRCRACTKTDDCMHHGLWFRFLAGPSVNYCEL